jgi:CRISPR system Cascade subunit CasA
LWETGQWDARKLDDYLVQYQSRFDLFDEQQPFYQVAQFPQGVDPGPNPVSQLSQELSSGNNPTLFDHHFDLTPRSIPPAEAAQRLVTVQAFTIGFGRSHKEGNSYIYRKDGPCTRGALFLVQGETLFQTLLLNMREYPYAGSRLPDTPNDKPAWEMDNALIPRRDTPLGYLDYLTWQSLQIRLLPETDEEGNTCVRQIHRLQGLGIDKNVLDPLKSYRESSRGKPIPLGFSTNKALWRDSVSLFELADKGRNTPETFKLLSRLVRFGPLTKEQKLRYLAFGIATEKGKAANVALWRYERMPLPLAYLTDEVVVERLRNALSLAEDVRRQLEEARDWLVWLWLIKPNDTKPPERKVRNKDNQFIRLQARFEISHSYWWRLEEPFHKAMKGLASDEIHTEHAMLIWRDTLKDSAREAFQELVGGIEKSPRALKAKVKAEGRLRGGLAYALKTDESQGGIDDESAH